MLISEDIVGKRFLKLGAVVELLKDKEEKDNLFTDFPIGTTIQDGGKRKRSDESPLSSTLTITNYLDFQKILLNLR